MEEEQILRNFEHYVKKFFADFNQDTFKSEKDDCLHEIIIKNKEAMMLFFDKIKPFWSYLNFATYNITFDGISKITREEKEQFQIYSKKWFPGDLEQILIFQPEAMHFLQEESNKKKTAVAIVTKGTGVGHEFFSQGDEKDELYIDGRHVVLIYPYLSDYSEEKEKKRLLRYHFNLKINNSNIIRAFSEEELFNLGMTPLDQHAKGSDTQTKKYTLDDKLIAYFDYEYKITPLPQKKMTQIIIDPREKEENVRKAVDYLKEMYPNSFILYDEKPNRPVIEIVDI